VCHGPNIKTSDTKSKRPVERDGALFRVRRCVDCRYEGITIEFWIKGDAASDAVEAMLGADFAA
jgi:hypothetical protein